MSNVDVNVCAEGGKNLHVFYLEPCKIACVFYLKNDQLAFLFNSNLGVLPLNDVHTDIKWTQNGPLV